MSDEAPDPPSHPLIEPRRGIHRILRARWLRRAFTAENLLGAFKTFAWVGPLTLLIWVWAEREQTDTEGWSMPISVRTSAPDRIVTILSPADPNLIINVSGPRGQLDRLRSQLTGGNQPAGAPILISPNLPPGEQIRDTVDLLNSQSIFNDTGVVVISAVPNTVKLFVDEVVEREARVAVPQEIERSLDAPPIFDPPVVKIRGPKTVLDALTAGPDGKLIVFANLFSFAAIRQPGVHDLADVPLTLPVENEFVTLSTPKVTASLRLRQTDVEYVIPSLGILVIAPPALLDAYKVIVADNVPIRANVKVTGPQSRIELLKQENFTPRPKALLEISREDATTANIGQSRMRRLRFDLPEGIIVSAEDAAREVEFKIVVRGATE